MEKRKNGNKSRPRSKSQVIDFSQYRRSKNEQKRREYERLLFNRVLGVYGFVEAPKLSHIEVMDISYSGVRFRHRFPEFEYPIGQKIGIRFYFTPSSFLKLIVDVRRLSRFQDGGVSGLEYGCEIDKTTKSYQVIEQLVTFLEKYSEVACKDSNPPMIWF